jgi:hypothetical protein
LGQRRENTARCDPWEPERDGRGNSRLEKANDGSIGAHGRQLLISGRCNATGVS